MDETGKPTELGRAVSARYREIMIDEFQDTNEVQNQIFCGRIPGGKEFVHGGDMKQSIYRFRLADPRFSCATIRQTLCSVRRRRGRSASCCSAVFPLPPGDFGCGQLCMRQPDESGSGGKWLHGRQALHFGAEYYVERSGCDTEFYLVDHPKKMRKPRQKKRSNALKRKRALWPAAFGHCWTNRFLCRMRRAGCAPVREEDIVILLRSPGARQKLYERVLSEQRIACSAEGGEEFFSAMEVAVVYAMLQLIDNPHQDVPLISVLRSPVFAFAPDRLAEIRARCPKGDFFHCAAVRRRGRYPAFSGGSGAAALSGSGYERAPAALAFV